MQLATLSLTFDPAKQQSGQLVLSRLEADVVDPDLEMHLFEITDQYESARVTVGRLFLSLEGDQGKLTLGLKPLEGSGIHTLTVAIDGERQAVRLRTLVP